MEDKNFSKVEELLQKMTLEEKIAQTMSIYLTDLDLSEGEKEIVLKTGELQNENVKNLLKHGMGAFQLPGKKLPIKECITYRNILQKYVLENTRLQIPVLIQEECLNGHLAKGATVYPRPIAMAGSFDTELVEEVFSAIGKETRIRGGHQAFTPVLDVGRDPRWGRIEETFGEDTYLVTRMGVAAVKGLQGGDNGTTVDHIISTPKHFAGYAQSEGGRNFAPTHITTRILKDEILPPFEAAVKDGKCMGIMPSHAEIDGIPCHGNEWLLKEVLRKEWGFEGVIVSDYSDIERLALLHHVAEDRKEAAVQALQASVDIDAPGGVSYAYLKDAIKENPKLEEILDEAVRRILTVKYRIGLFDNIYADTNKSEIVNCQEHKKLAEKIAEESVILLKNDNHILPLHEDKLKKIAVLGPNADTVEFSYYSERPNIGVSILEGIKGRVKEKFQIYYEKGCEITKEKLAMETEMDAVLENPGLYTLEEEEESIQKAVEVAKDSDIAIVCLGGSPDTSREAVGLKSHYGDNANLDLVGQQNELLQRVLDTGTPTIVILINGKPLSCGLVYEKANAVLEGWYLGQATGVAIANILFGDVNPSAKLPVTIVRNAGHLPGYYSQRNTGFLKKYLFEEENPYYWFGYGLSYTKFAYENIQLKENIEKDNRLASVSAEIKNVGTRKGTEIVQLYISDTKASVTRPEKELKGFVRLTLEPNEVQKVSFDIAEEMLEFTGVHYQKGIEKGEFILMIGKNCREGLKTTFVLK